MQKYTAFFIALILLVTPACTRQTTGTDITEASALLTAADDGYFTEAETTQTVSETLSASETQTAVVATTQPPATTTQPPETTTQPPATTTQPPETTTQPPATTTQPPETTTQPTPESGSEPFTFKRVRVYRSYDRDFEATADVAGSREQLDDLLCTFAGRCDPKIKENDDFAEYTDAWFASNRLIVVFTQEGSGSYKHDVRKVTYTDNGASVKIMRTSPQVITCDIAHWVILIELPDTRLQGGEPVELELYWG